ncbi:LuxR family transcriptional regulator [Nocardia sp. NPDC051570]|uniref:LuxR family transcriptional regulator n=1 Tax=Nocardia sp. NPDC051570 TaxID=3364324 RepID=UPI0037992DDC
MASVNRRSGTPATAYAAGAFDENAYTPKSISHVLYLIAANHPGDMDAATVRQLRAAHLCCVRGDLRTALKLVDELLTQLHDAGLGADSVAGFRLFLQSMITEPSGRPARMDTQIDSDKPGIFTTVSQCIESNERWYSGELTEGLRLNQIAVDSARDLPATWQLYSTLLLSKKLTDVHVPVQALATIADLGEHARRSGLQIYESVHLALRSAVELQSADFERAIRTARESMRMAEERETTIGVKLAWSVLGYAYAGSGRFSEATTALREFYARSTDYVLPDSIARAKFAEIAVIAACHGNRVVDRIQSNWDLLGTDAGFFLEDLSRPAWLITTCARAGATDLATRALHAIERLAEKNPQVPAAIAALDLARDAFANPEDAPPALLTAHEVDFEIVPLRLPPATEPVVIFDSSLSQREKDVAALVERGMTNRQIANQLGISPHTVNFHLRKIFRKLSISTRSELSSLVAGNRHHD